VYLKNLTTVCKLQYDMVRETNMDWKLSIVSLI